jgi:hypothetical protein
MFCQGYLDSSIVYKNIVLSSYAPGCHFPVRTDEGNEEITAEGTKGVRAHFIGSSFTEIYKVQECNVEKCIECGLAVRIESSHYGMHIMEIQDEGYLA